MLELLRTPSYPSIQGERWLFCCKGPMTYVGQWSRQKFTEMAPDGDGRAFLAGSCAIRSQGCGRTSSTT
jgi:uncharacterized protein CbrC (UPF0167 family)